MMELVEKNPVFESSREHSVTGNHNNQIYSAQPSPPKQQKQPHRVWAVVAVIAILAVTVASIAIAAFIIFKPSTSEPTALSVSEMQVLRQQVTEDLKQLLEQKVNSTQMQQHLAEVTQELQHQLNTSTQLVMQELKLQLNSSNQTLATAIGNVLSEFNEALDATQNSISKEFQFQLNSTFDQLAVRLNKSEKDIQDLKVHVNHYNHAFLQKSLNISDNIRSLQGQIDSLMINSSLAVSPTTSESKSWFFDST